MIINHHSALTVTVTIINSHEHPHSEVDKAGNMASVAVLTNDGSKLAGPEFIQYSAQPLELQVGKVWRWGWKDAKLTRTWYTYIILYVYDVYIYICLCV